MNAPLAFTCGDPAGVGPEIIAAWLAAHAADARDVAVIGPGRWLAAIDLHGATGIAVDASMAVASAGGASAVGALDEMAAFSATLGQPSIEGARVALAAMERAAEGTRSGEFSGVVTGPVSKSWLQKAGYEFPGQTEFFAARWGGEPTMAFCGGRLRVVLLTWHIPLREVPAQLTPGNFSRAVAAADELARAEGIAAPRIGVCGLNPHAGEDGMLGSEEREVIDPILDGLRVRFPGLSRCEPGDTIFSRALGRSAHVVKAVNSGVEVGETMDGSEVGGADGVSAATRGDGGSLTDRGAERAATESTRSRSQLRGTGALGRGAEARGEFDVVIALYHDQGLAPLKTIDFDEAVNVTLGLPHVRTSPDHGTAFGIAGKGVASATSFSNAVLVARRLIKRRGGR